ncbi:L-lactate dehydrogenase B chain-like [Drosophila busckii]|uniref:L-lactate dehydrogenase B chain-like n=1 Tax=Drosophila busckii TaxID=30019 RepID=UPI0014333BA1|nr:L-lactate dehydrogenase B chain-like [Drosophila busckii]
MFLKRYLFNLPPSRKSMPTAYLFDCRRTFFSRKPKKSDKKAECERKAKEKKDELFRTFLKCFYKNLERQDVQAGNKVSIIGTGMAGIACAMALVSRGISSNIALHDINQELCEAERLDLLHGAMFTSTSKINKCTTVESTKNSRVIIISAGARTTGKQSRLDVAHESADIIKQVVPEALKYSPKAVFIIASNPVDVMTWYTRELTNLPIERCFSSGCHLDTARFRMYIAKQLKLSAHSVDGYVLGEHGDSSVPIWSSVTVGGVPLIDIKANIGSDEDSMRWSDVHQNVVTAAKQVISGKGYTNWALGFTIADIVSAIFEDSKRILPLSTNARGICGIQDDVFLSLPCIVNKCGICGIVYPNLTEWESDKLRNSAATLLKVQQSIK